MALIKSLVFFIHYTTVGRRNSSQPIRTGALVKLFETVLLPFLFRGPNLCRQFYIISHLRNSAHQFHKTDSIFHPSELHDNRLPISMYIKFIYSRSSQKIIIGQRKFFQTYHINSQNRLAFLIIQEIENNILFFFSNRFFC